MSNLVKHHRLRRTFWCQLNLLCCFPIFVNQVHFLHPTDCGLLLWPQTPCCAEQNAGVVSWRDLLTALSKDLAIGDLIQKADRCWSSFASSKILLAAMQLKILFSVNACELDIWLLWGMLSHTPISHLDSACTGLGCCPVPQTWSGQYLPGF